ncbi:MFS general substrate transporter [Xylaria castorea]|nr:MFS general substrate transporter [Xylaria castorea]
METHSGKHDMPPSMDGHSLETTGMSNEMPSASSGHNLSPMDPDSPMMWPLWKKCYTSFVSFSFAFVVLYGTTTYTSAIPDIKTGLGVSQHVANLGFTLPFFGVFFAPIYTPHLTEIFGRRPVYLTSFPLYLLAVVVIGLASNPSTLLAFRFLAGLFGGPCLVLIEGTFADIWSAERTVTYYSFLTLASYWGAAFGPIIGGFVLAARGIPWLSWVTLLFGTVALAFGCAMPETYGRAILRKRIHYQQSNIKLPDAPSGVTISQMVRLTVFSPLKMFVTEPIVLLASLHLGLNFAVTFQWFISVPAALGMAYGFDVKRAGLAFISALGGSALALASGCLIEALTWSRSKGTKGGNGMGPAIETRLIGAIIGSLLLVASLFWVGYSVDPTISYYAPIFGTAVYVWGSALVVISYISYLFDAYPPQGTLSALTAAACFRLAAAGIIPIFILDMITNLGGKWAFGTFGVILAAFVFFPIVLFFLGARFRARSSYTTRGAMNTMAMEMATKAQDKKSHGHTMSV